MMASKAPENPAPAKLRDRITGAADHFVALLSPRTVALSGRFHQVTLITWAAVVAGLAIRAFRLWQPGSAYRLSADAPAVYGAAARWIAGDTLYGGITLMHPPGAAAFYVPFALFGRIAGDRLALLASYAAGTLLAGLAIWLIGYIVRPWGRTAVFVACGLYAATPVIVAVDKNAQLELFLTLGVLGAIALLFRAQTPHPVWAGLALGAASTVKIWGIADIALLVIVLAVFAGIWASLKFALGCALPFVAFLPTFLAAPNATVTSLVWAQLGRPVMKNAVNLLFRFSQAFPVRSGGNGQSVPFATLCLGIGLVLVAASIVVLIAGLAGLNRSFDSKLGTMPALLTIIGLVALLNLAIVLKSPSYYGHYYVFPLVPQILALAAVLAVAAHARPARCVPLWAAAGTAMALAGIVAAQNAPVHGYSGDAAKVRAIVAKHRCLWGMPPDLALSDAISPNAANHCGAITDPFGRSMIGAHNQNLTSVRAMQKGSEYRSAMYQWLRRSDAFVAPTLSRIYSLDPGAKTYVEQNFKRVGEYWNREWWVRK